MLDVWLTVQTNWLYLERIFNHADIIKQIPEEGHRFTSVDKTWRELMKTCLQDSHVLVVIKIEKIIGKLKESYASLELILKVKNKKNSRINNEKDDFLVLVMINFSYRILMNILKRNV